MRKSLSNEKSTEESQSLNSELVSTVNSNYNKLNSVQKDIHQIHEQLESLIEMNTAKGLKRLLRKQLESIITEAETKSKQEAIQYLKNSQAELLYQKIKLMIKY
ncbi:hypothetical protein [Crocosphaera watsonii]|uniref:Uncharacterized protein n=1 Tax=Crocosphaera watsonii WH 8502 TaxID=423474 RepID=T2IFA9_CROWT|nr:hypothetical protein [Crocosphaera watsonii]CCQ52211.1 hypothetical protein CWATWH8502_4244 [Crocosphaera watsonii WH 8502]